MNEATTTLTRAARRFKFFEVRTMRTRTITSPAVSSPHRLQKIAAIIGALAVGGAAIGYFRSASAPSNRLSLAPAAPPAATATLAVHASPTDPRDYSVDPAALSTLPPGERAPFRTPTVEQYEQLKAFEQRVRSFFHDPKKTSGPERAKQAVALRDEIAAAESAGQLTSAEALTLYIALMHESGLPPGEIKPAAPTLVDGYRAKADARDSALAANPDPRHLSYKRDEE
ncbi:MAG: hypothetical protein ABIU95_13355, partial [Burkholderiales bacterium]